MAQVGQDGGLPTSILPANFPTLAMSDSDELICKPTKWFLWRAVAMAAMFGVGAFLFFKDWKWGYPKKNVEKYYYLAFEKANETFAAHLKEGKSAEDWESFASEQKVFIPFEKNGVKVEDVVPTLPADTNFETKWPEILVDFEGYSKLYEAEKNTPVPVAWKDFSNSEGRKWSEKSDGEVKSEGKIKEQLYIGILCLILFLGALFIFLRTMGRSMRVNAEGYFPPGGKLIPFDQIKKIDARKWGTKGLAYLYYDRDGSRKKTKVDGMVYGQFKKEDGEPAQKLYDRILANFQGELIELAPEEDEEGAGGSDEPATNDSSQ